MRIVSVLENQLIEKRIAITPEIAKKYIGLGFEVSLSENYGEHLGFRDKEYKELGVEISNNDNQIIKSADLIVQLGLLSDDKISYTKENQILIGVFGMLIHHNVTVSAPTTLPSNAAIKMMKNRSNECVTYGRNQNSLDLISLVY